MNPTEYQVNASRTEAPAGDAYQRLLGSDDLPPNDNTTPTRLLHAVLGMTTEVGEIADQIKKHIFYGKEYKKDNAAEELGDLLWYIALYCNVSGFDLGEIMKANIEKLRARFPNKFTQEEALNRDTKAEMKALRENISEMRGVD